MAVKKRIIIEVSDFSDEFGDVVDNVHTALDCIEGLHDYTIRAEDVLQPRIRAWEVTFSYYNEHDANRPESLSETYTTMAVDEDEAIRNTYEFTGETNLYLRGIELCK
jgi:hypothetical protein